MPTEKQFAAAFRARVEHEARSAFVEDTATEELPVFLTETAHGASAGSRNRVILAAAACVLAVAAVGAALQPRSGTDAPAAPSASTDPEPTPAAGQVGLATHESESVMLALARGELTVIDGCLALDDLLLVLDTQSWSWDPDAGILTNLRSKAHGGIRIGEQMTIGGGWVGSESRQAGYNVTFPGSCADYEGGWFVG
jgi:hypothetical protein